MMIPRLLLKIYRFHKSLSIYILLSQMYKDFAQFVFFIKLILFFNFCDIMLYYNNSHGQNEVNQVKKKTLVPLITFLLGICLISLIVYKTDTHEKEQRHITAQLNVATYRRLQCMQFQTIHLAIIFHLRFYLHRDFFILYRCLM